MRTRALCIFGLLAAIIALPLALQRETAVGSSRKANDTIVIITPHNESIRNEFGEAFARWWRTRTGRSVHIDWRTPGGTSEIRMVLDAGFKAAKETGRNGVGIDVFFGGGEPDFNSQSKQGRFEPLRVFSTMPELFGPDAAIPETFTGERYISPSRDWVGTCVSQFGICYNPDFVARLGLPAPKTWRDLGDPRYAGSLALADPTKSGSVARTFELIVQAEMLRRMREHPEDPNAAAHGWEDGLRLIQRLAANARYFTDSGSKIPHDVGQGNAAAGMCIDFYGRSYAADLTTRDGRPRIVWIAPHAGTTLSADPVAVLRGTMAPEISQSFVEFCLTREAQTLWCACPGTPDGPVSRALQRLPIRRDVYTPEFLERSTLPVGSPYLDSGNFTYDRALTGKAFNTLRQLVKVMCIDPHDELKEAWTTLRDTGMPEDAVSAFHDVSRASYAAAGQGDPAFDQARPLDAARHAADMAGWFRMNYQTATKMARRNCRHLTTTP